jgi:hypothetical protein
MRRWIAGLVGTLLLAETVYSDECQWIVVTAPAFRKAVQPLCEHRKAQGFHVVVVVQTTDLLDAGQIRSGDAEKLRDRVAALCRDFKGTSYVLLVGAAEAGRLREPEKVLAPAMRGTVSRMKGQPSDNGYGCPDVDLMPTVPVGRFPARAVAEAEAMVAKTIAFERDDKPGEWRRRLTILAGIPAYNPIVDRLVESQAMARLDKLSPAWRGQALYQNPQSRFCVPDDQLHDRALGYVQGGQAFTLYLGHSNAAELWGNGARFLDRDDWAKLTVRGGAGVFATFGCNGCQLSGPDGEGYGVAAARNPNGPVAVLGSHGICFAAMVQLAADGMFRAGFVEQCPERLGSLWLGLKSGLAKGKIDPLAYNLLDAVDGDAKIPQEVQRQEHLEMFVLLGDPALRLPLVADDVKVSVDGEVVAGETIDIHVELPERLVGGKVQITLERPPSTEPSELVPVPKKPGPERDRALATNHERANLFVVAMKELSVPQRQFKTKILIPSFPNGLPWPRLILRAYAVTERAEGIGAKVVPASEK